MPKKSLLMDPLPSAQAEKSETTVKTPESDGTLQENTEGFFLTQVWTLLCVSCPIYALQKKKSQ